MWLAPDGGGSGGAKGRVSLEGSPACLIIPYHYIISVPEWVLQVPWYSFVNQLNSHCCPIIFDGSTMVSSSHVSFEKRLLKVPCYRDIIYLPLKGLTVMYLDFLYVLCLTGAWVIDQSGKKKPQDFKVLANARFKCSHFSGADNMIGMKITARYWNKPVEILVLRDV